MNGMWGYKIMNQNYKSVPELIELLVNARGKGANLLLNIGLQPNGELPAAALDRLKGMGEWLRANGETVYGVRAADFPAQSWERPHAKATSYISTYSVPKATRSQCPLR